MFRAHRILAAVTFVAVFALSGCGEEEGESVVIANNDTTTTTADPNAFDPVLGVRLVPQDCDPTERDCAAEFMFGRDGRWILDGPNNAELEGTLSRDTGNLVVAAAEETRPNDVVVGEPSAECRNQVSGQEAVLIFPLGGGREISVCDAQLDPDHPLLEAANLAVREAVSTIPNAPTSTTFANA